MSEVARPSLEHRLTARLDRAPSPGDRVSRRAARMARGELRGAIGARRSALSTRWDGPALRASASRSAAARVTRRGVFRDIAQPLGSHTGSSFVVAPPPWIARAEAAEREGLIPTVRRSAAISPPDNVIHGWGAFVGAQSTATVARSRAGILSRSTGVAPPSGLAARRVAVPFAPPPLALSSLALPSIPLPSAAPSDFAPALARTATSLRPQPLSAPGLQRRAQSPFTTAVSRAERGGGVLARTLGTSVPAPTAPGTRGPLARSEEAGEVRSAQPLSSPGSLASALAARAVRRSPDGRGLTTPIARSAPSLPGATARPVLRSVDGGSDLAPSQASMGAEAGPRLTRRSSGAVPTMAIALARSGARVEGRGLSRRVGDPSGSAPSMVALRAPFSPGESLAPELGGSAVTFRPVARNAASPVGPTAGVAPSPWTVVPRAATTQPFASGVAPRLVARGDAPASSSTQIGRAVVPRRVGAPTALQRASLRAVDPHGVVAQAARRSGVAPSSPSAGWTSPLAESVARGAVTSRSAHTGVDRSFAEPTGPRPRPLGAAVARSSTVAAARAGSARPGRFVARSHSVELALAAPPVVNARRDTSELGAPVTATGSMASSASTVARIARPLTGTSTRASSASGSTADRLTPSSIRSYPASRPLVGPPSTRAIPVDLVAPALSRQAAPGLPTLAEPGGSPAGASRSALAPALASHGPAAGPTPSFLAAASRSESMTARRPVSAVARAFYAAAEVPALGAAGTRSRTGSIVRLEAPDSPLSRSIGRAEPEPTRRARVRSPAVAPALVLPPAPSTLGSTPTAEATGTEARPAGRSALASAPRTEPTATPVGRTAAPLAQAAGRALSPASRATASTPSAADRVPALTRGPAGVSPLAAAPDGPRISGRAGRRSLSPSARILGRSTQTPTLDAATSAPGRASVRETGSPGVGRVSATHVHAALRPLARATTEPRTSLHPVGTSWTALAALGGARRSTLPSAPATLASLPAAFLHRAVEGDAAGSWIDGPRAPERWSASGGSTTGPSAPASGLREDGRPVAPARDTGSRPAPRAPAPQRPIAVGPSFVLPALPGSLAAGSPVARSLAVGSSIVPTGSEPSPHPRSGRSEATRSGSPAARALSRAAMSLGHAAPRHQPLPGRRSISAEGPIQRAQSRVDRSAVASAARPLSRAATLGTPTLPLAAPQPFQRRAADESPDAARRGPGAPRFDSTASEGPAVGGTGWSPTERHVPPGRPGSTTQTASRTTTPSSAVSRAVAREADPMVLSTPNQKSTARRTGGFRGGYASAAPTTLTSAFGLVPRSRAVQDEGRAPSQGMTPRRQGEATSASSWSELATGSPEAPGASYAARSSLRAPPLARALATSGEPVSHSARAAARSQGVLTRRPSSTAPTLAMAELRRAVQSGVAPDAELLARVARASGAQGFPARSASQGPPTATLADASRLVRRAADRLVERELADERQRRPATRGASAPSRAARMTVDGPALSRMVAREVSELTIVAGPAPAAHRSTLLVRRSEAESAPAAPGRAGAGGAEKKGAFDADGFLRQLVRQILHEEGLHKARDLTPWD